MTVAIPVAEQYTLLTVAHREDFGLMRLQARSLAKYLNPDLASEILVVENPQSGRPTLWRTILRKDYGPLAAKVRFVEAREIANIPGNLSGWFSQQILKLMASSIVSTDRYIVLDGKNHLVHPLSRNFIETPSGQLRSYLMSYAVHPMKPFLQNTLDYFGLDAARHMHAFVPTTTPFSLPTAKVRELVRYIEAREMQPFAQAFVYDGYKRSEFFLFAAYIISCGESLSDLYDWSQGKCPAIWPESTAAQCSEAIAAGDSKELPFFSLHRRALPTLRSATRHEIAAFWHRRGLFKDERASLRFLTEPDQSMA